jgi:DNA mismatch repair ATPase MutS
LRKIVDELRSQLNKSLDALKLHQAAPASNAASSEDLERLQNEIEKLKHLFDDRLGQLLSLIDKKADRVELDSLEKRINDHINELIKSLLDKFTDKKDFFKRIASLEKQVFL